MRYVSSLPRLPSGQVRRLYDAVSFKRLHTLQDVSDGQNIVAVTHENLRKIAYQVVDLNIKSPINPSADSVCFVFVLIGRFLKLCISSLTVILITQVCVCVLPREDLLLCKR